MSHGLMGELDFEYPGLAGLATVSTSEKYPSKGRLDPSHSGRFPVGTTKSLVL